MGNVLVKSCKGSLFCPFFIMQKIKKTLLEGQMKAFQDCSAQFENKMSLGCRKNNTNNSSIKRDINQHIKMMFLQFLIPASLPAYAFQTFLSFFSFQEQFCRLNKKEGTEIEVAVT